MRARKFASPSGARQFLQFFGVRLRRNIDSVGKRLFTQKEPPRRLEELRFVHCIHYTG
jgi:hypothetical protein